MNDSRCNLDLETKNQMGFSLLHIACFNENPEVVELLLDAGCRPNSLNTKGQTPLMLIAQKFNFILCIYALLELTSRSYSFSCRRAPTRTSRTASSIQHCTTPARTARSRSSARSSSRRGPTSSLRTAGARRRSSARATRGSSCCSRRMSAPTLRGRECLTPSRPR